MSLLDSNAKRVLTDIQKLPLGEISRAALREVVSAGAAKASEKEAAEEKKEEPKKEAAAEKKDK